MRGFRADRANSRASRPIWSRCKVDVIVTGGGTLGALAAKQATTTIPIVFGAVGDPVGEGLVASLSRPGGNATGLSINSPELASKSLELLKQTIPRMSRVAMLLKPDAMPDAYQEGQTGAMGRRGAGAGGATPSRGGASSRGLRPGLR